MKSSKVIRQEFIDFFVKKGHTFVPSADVIPHHDPTLLFTNAGMNQFKDIFLGVEAPKFPRAVNSQKCIRAGGKHNDLDEVGKDGYHHTFFEMLGNWSFGDYYKRDAISWAWELFTDVWKIPKDRLYATVHVSDSEAYELWKSLTDITVDHISYHGDKYNFWEMGETGPCGPCSEIHIDLGTEYCNLAGTPHICAVNGECHRYIELWNIVFIQNQRHADRSLSVLKDKYVDTGAGFERICQVLQNVTSNYETDVFQPIIKEIARISQCDDSPESIIAQRVIADHIRALAFSIADGGIPSNEGRGYVIRRILRRASRYGQKINLSEPFLYKLIDILIENMGDHYRELSIKSTFIKNIIQGEEERFLQTLDKGLTLFDEMVSKLSSVDPTVPATNVIPGKMAFTLYDTYGFPLDLTRIIAEERGLSVDEAGFYAEMELQKSRAREASKFGTQSTVTDWIVLSPLSKSVMTESGTVFVGYDTTTCDSSIVKYAKVGESDVLLVLDVTPFYAESGGQIADTGHLKDDSSGTLIEITNVQKEGNELMHVGKVISGKVSDARYIATVSSRDDITKNHTATHILHSALKHVLGDHVQQKGSFVSSLSLRFDFTHFGAMTPEEIRQVEDLVNDKIMYAYPVLTDIQSVEDAKKGGAIALFGEKYADEVRVVSIDDFSKELCGGTHVKNTGQIGLFKVISESSSSAGVRRIEAITGRHLRQHLLQTETALSEICNLLSANKQNIYQKISSLRDENETLRQDIQRLKNQSNNATLDELIAQKTLVGDINLVFGLVSAAVPDDMKNMGDYLKEKIPPGIGVLVAQIEGKVSIIVVVTATLTSKISAGKIVAQLVTIVNGRGGGRPDMAMAGGKDIDQIPQLINQIPHIVTSIVNSV
jgi:alanyl-tRNA synthetase